MEQDPVGGFGLLAAASMLLPDPHLPFFAARLKSRNSQDPRDVSVVVNAQSVLWKALAAALQSGELRATGIAPGALLPTAIYPGFFNGAEPDFDRDRVTLNGATYASVQIFRGNTTAPSVPPLSPPAHPNDGRVPFDFAKAEAELIGMKVRWERDGKKTPAPTEKDLQVIIAQRFLPPWSRDQIRELLKIWPKADRRQGPRKCSAVSRISAS